MSSEREYRFVAAHGVEYRERSSTYSDWSRWRRLIPEMLAALDADELAQVVDAMRGGRHCFACPDDVVSLALNIMRYCVNDAQSGACELTKSQAAAVLARLDAQDALLRRWLAWYRTGYRKSAGDIADDTARCVEP